MSSLSRRIEIAERAVADLCPPAPDHGRLTDEQLIDIIAHHEQRLAALTPAERQSVSDAAGIIPSRIRQMSDAALESAIVRAERRLAALEARHG